VVVKIIEIGLVLRQVQLDKAAALVVLPCLTNCCAKVEIK